MTSAILAPRRRRGPAGKASVRGSVEPTKILDWQHPALILLLDHVREGKRRDQLDLLRHAHAVISDTIRPVYSVRDDLPVSKIIQRGRGSCSQRLAVLEALARASGIPTRVRGLLLDGRFWYPRFPRLHSLVPNEVVLAWPEFDLSGIWLSASELLAVTRAPVRTPAPFTNDTSETLFDALARTAIDWDGSKQPVTDCPRCDLSAQVLADLAYYPSRDALFTEQRQTLCLPARTLAEPLMSRWSAGTIPTYRNARPD